MLLGQQLKVEWKEVVLDGSITREDLRCASSKANVSDGWKNGKSVHCRNNELSEKLKRTLAPLNEKRKNHKQEISELRNR